MTREQAIDFIAHTLGYGTDNAKDWTLAAGFADDSTWTHPAGVLTVTWLGHDSYAVTESS